MAHRGVNPLAIDRPDVHFSQIGKLYLGLWILDQHSFSCRDRLLFGVDGESPDDPGALVYLNSPAVAANGAEVGNDFRMLLALVGSCSHAGDDTTSAENSNPASCWTSILWPAGRCYTRRGQEAGSLPPGNGGGTVAYVAKIASSSSNVSVPMIRTLTTLAIAFIAVAPVFGNAFVGIGNNLIANGGFETPAVMGGDQEFTAPSIAISSWQVSEGSIDLITSGSILGTAHNGLQMIDINGSRAGTIEQSFPTVPGNRYRLEAFYSNNPNPASAQPSYSARIGLIGTTQLLNALVAHSGATEVDMNWLRFAHSFVADSPTTKLVLSSAQGGFNGIYFDSVSVIPEPTHAALLASLGGSVAMWASRRLRRP